MALQKTENKTPTHAPVIDIAKAATKRMNAQQVEVERARLEREAVMQMNETHALARVKGRTFILMEEPDELGNPSYILSAEKDFNLFYRNVTVSLPKMTRSGVTYEQKSVAPIWLAHPERRTVTRIVFKPSGGETSAEYNVFKGWGVKPAAYDPENPTRGCAKIIDLCQRLFGRGPHGDWAMAWLADLFQNPEEKPGTALVLRSKEGAGKGTLMNAVLGPILMNAYVHIGNRKHLTSNFNSILQGTLLFFVDEAIWAGDKEGEGALKYLITEPTLMIEGKGKDAFAIANLARVVFASNEKWVVPVGPHGRRFHVVDCDEEMAQNTRYFDAIRAEANNGGREAFFSYLMNFDTSKFDLRNPPVTDALVSQKIQTLRSDSVAHWFFERLYEGVLAGDDDTLADGWPKTITRDRTRASYGAYCKRMNVRYPASAEEIGTFFKEKMGIRSGRASKPGTDGTRPMLYDFTSPEEHHYPEDAERERLAYWRGIFESTMFGGTYAGWPEYEGTGKEINLVENQHRNVDVDDNEIPF